MRVFAVLCCFVATGCSPSIELPPASYVPPSPPSAKAEYDGANQAAVETKLTGSVEISDVRESDHGPGRYVVCLRGSDSPFSPRRTYAARSDDIARGPGGLVPAIASVLGQSVCGEE